MHLRFDCPKLVGRSRYQPPVEPAVSLESVLPKFFEDVEKFLDYSAGEEHN